MQPLAIAGIGFLLGLRHALDADHVVAVTTIVSRERSFRRAASVGALWGLGHSAALLVAGGAIIAFRLVVPPRVGLTLELGVAFMLIILGYFNLRAPDPHRHPHPPMWPGRPLLVGVVHGLAGSAAAALLVLATIRTTAAALAYLLVFGVGTIAGMTLVTAMLALPSRLTATRMPRYERGIRVMAGVISLALGLFIAYEIVVDAGLWSPTPRWTPG